MMRSRTSIVFFAVILGFLELLGSCGDNGGGGGTTVKGGDPISGNIVFTNPWKGEWNVVIAFEDCNTGDTLEIEDISDVVCEGDTLDLELSDLLEDCTGSISDTRLTVDCTYRFTDAGCTVDLAFTLDLERQGNTITGMGQWSAMVSGTCPDNIAGCENLVINGTRIETDPPECATPQPLNVADRLGLRPRLFIRPHTR